MCNRVDLPDPVLPAIKTCWLVPRPSRRYCSRAAPALPIGRSTPSGVVWVQISFDLGAMRVNDTSTRRALRDFSPTARTRLTYCAAGGEVRAENFNASGSSVMALRPKRDRKLTNRFDGQYDKYYESAVKKQSVESVSCLALAVP